MEIPGKGTLLQHGITTVVGQSSTTAYTTLAQRVSIDGPSTTQGEKNNTNLDDACVRTSPSIPDPGELTLKIFYDPKSATHALLWAMHLSGADDPWKLIYNDAAVVTDRSFETFTGWIKSFAKNGMEVEGNLGADVVIRLTSMPVLTPRA
jgi:hypothetical protein